MSSDDIVINVSNLSKRYEIYASPPDRLKQLVMPHLLRPIRRISERIGIPGGHEEYKYFREFWALRDISFQVKRGEAVGIVGRNGSGKSTLLQILAGTLSATSGTTTVNGRVAALLELGTGFDPEFSGHDNVFLNGRLLGLTQKEVEARYDEIVEFADIGDFIDQPVKTYSSGMFVRLAFAVQAHIDAAIIIIDEALAVGDVFFRQKCYTRLERLRKSGAAILLVSHAMTDIEQYCERAVVLDRGAQKFLGPASEAVKRYYLLHQSATPQKPAIRGDMPPASPSAKNSSRNIIDPVPAEAFLDLSAKSQVSNGQAHCTRIALCNAAGEACNSFRQGDRAVFYYEFDVAEPIEIPICGIVISNDRGVIVHGKNSWQCDDDVPQSLGRGSKVVCRQEVTLALAPGDYVFEIGLASVPMTHWKNRELMSHEEANANFIRVCHLAGAGFFSVGLTSKNGVSKLTHHGVADLDGNMNIAVYADGETDE